MDKNKRQEFVEVSKAARSPDMCFHPHAPGDCTQTIVNAHLVQKKILLDGVAENGHVLEFSAEAGHILRNGPFVPRSRGVNEASTFRGFCQKHDDQFFACLEKKPLEFIRHQAFLMLYRAIANELHAKARMYLTGGNMAIKARADKGPSVEVDVDQWNIGLSMFASASVDGGHLRQDWMRLAEAWRTNPDIGVDGWHIVFDRPLPVVFCNLLISAQQKESCPDCR
jgi:hypothetical protein